MLRTLTRRFESRARVRQVNAAGHGDQVGAAALIDEILPRMRKLVRHLVRNDSDIEDFTQEAAVAVWRSLPGYRGEGFFEHWVDKVVTRAIFGERRRRRTARSLVDVEGNRGSFEGLSVVQDEYLNRRRAIRLLALLPIEQRQVVVRHHILEMSVPEIATELAIPFETVRSRCVWRAGGCVPWACARWSTRGQRRCKKARMSAQQVLIAGRWRPSQANGSFRADNPTTKEPLPDEYPISSWQECDEALNAAVAAAVVLRKTSGAKVGEFLDAFAARVEARKDEFVAMAHAETGLPKAPRLAEVEFPRTTGQLRQGAAAARDGSWTLPTIDTKANIRSMLAPIGPVCVFGPNNFPFAFNSAAGGDFTAAIAAGNPVIAKANSSHPGTTRLFAEEAEAAARQVGLPAATVQLIYRTSHADGERLVSDPRVGATGYTGSRSAGLKLKAAADAAGKAIYVELSSVNPVVVLPGALEERLEEVAAEFAGSCLMGAGQFCTNPGFVILQKGGKTDAFIKTIVEKFRAAPVGTLLSSAVEKTLTAAVATLTKAGAEILVGGTAGGGKGYSFANTLLLASGEHFLRNHAALQTEAFGNSSLLVVADDLGQLCQIVDHVEGSLTGCIYSHRGGADDAAYEKVAFHLRPLVGRLLNDKMPTGVAVSPAMNHGGPYPSTGHPGFTAVGIPASLRRFAMLQSFDAVRPARLPALLQDKNLTEKTWRLIDLEWTTRSL